ncbi:MAG: 1-deoxy-D-xylulose-5-phosphate reductoisomerase [Hyphomicrobiaceae bacterium]|jgi:1-deoxy-D-xylulose-5-phosphate reductoisomerase
MPSSQKKRVSILGSTGSIGTTTLELVSRFPNRFDIVALAAGRRVADLKDQIARFNPELVSIADPADAAHLRDALGADGPAVVSGPEGLCRVATAPGTDVLVSALVGAVGVPPTLAAVDAGIDIGLANKEVMVVAGELVGSRARKAGCTVLPIDSEHNAIFQALEGRRREHVAKIVLTASGGPFRATSAEDLRNVTRAQALAHPTWTMGEKISIDSATLMNKGLEVIEARWFFDAPPEMIDVVVHPQSIIHSMVRYRDGSVIAVMAIPDMTIPVAHVLAYPDLLDLEHLPVLDLPAARQLTFEQPDTERFPCLRLAFEALRAGGTMPAVVNAANEIAVERFLAGDIAFLEISSTVAATMAAHPVQSYVCVEDLYAVDAWARDHAANVASTRFAV